MAREVILTTDDFSANYVITFGEITDWNKLELEELLQVEAGFDKVEGNLLSGGEDILIGEGDIVVENPAKTSGTLKISVEGVGVTNILEPGESVTFPEPENLFGLVTVSPPSPEVVDKTDRITTIDAFYDITNGADVDVEVTLAVSIDGTTHDRPSLVVTAGDTTTAATEMTVPTPDIGEQEEKEVCVEKLAVEEFTGALF